MQRFLVFLWVLCVSGLCIEVRAAGAEQRGPLLLIDESRIPHVVIRWTRADGTATQLEADLPYTGPSDRTALGENIEVFVGLGGTRLEKGVGYAGGAIVRVGLAKTDRDLLMFADIANGSEVVIELTNVVFNQPVTPNRETIVQRLEYKIDDVVACGLTIDQTEMFNIVSKDDTMGGTILTEQVRFACLDGSDPNGSDPNGGDASVRVEENGSLSLRVVMPYRLLRHKGDPWALEVPGTFFEPFRFDLEYEVLPRDIAEAEGIEVGR